VRAFLYARVSTADKEQDPRPQIAEMTAFAKRRDWMRTDFTDRVSSAKHRPEFERMMDMARRGLCDVIICRHFDRIGRSTKQLLEMLDELHALKIDIVSINQQIDTTTPAGRMMFILIAAFAEYERSMLRERVMLGLVAARARGSVLGRPRRIADALKIRTLRAQRRPWSEVAKESGVSVSTARRIARNAPELPKPLKAVQKPVEKSARNRVDKKGKKKRKARA
jgi:DNA invertase Pin-like site-specific DNA recombinase